MSNPKSPTSNWPVRLAIAVGVLLVVYFGVSYAIRPVAMVVPVTRGISIRSVPGTVEVKAEFDRELKSAVGGRVQTSELKIGARILKNDVLVQIDTRDVELEIEHIQNDIIAARKKVELGSPYRQDVENSRDTLDNLERQTKVGNYPAAEFEKQRRSHQQLENKMNLDEVNNKVALDNLVNSLRSKELEKSKMTIVAPTDGDVTGVLAREGDLIDRNSPIATYIAVKRTVEGKLSEENFANVKLGQKATVRFLTFGKDQYPAVVSKILPSADPATQRYSVYLDVTLPEGRKLTPGITGEMTIIVAQRDNALLIPRRALVGEFVYVVEGSKVAVRKIDKGYDSLNYVEVLSGFKEGELVVAEQQDRLRDGERVRVQVLPN
jgi:RND family efflux transporter MFP subunit